MPARGTVEAARCSILNHIVTADGAALRRTRVKPQTHATYTPIPPLGADERISLGEAQRCTIQQCQCFLLLLPVVEKS